MIVFLLRHYNDIDHIVPIIYRMLKDNSAEIRVFCMDPFLDIRDDFRLRFLRETFGCRTRYIYQTHSSGFKHRLFSFLVCHLPYWKLLQVVPRFADIAGKVARLVYNSRWRRQLYDTAWARRFLDESQVAVLVVDWGKVKRYVYSPLSEAADQLGIPKVGIMVGSILVTDDYHQSEDLQTDMRKATNRWITYLTVDSQHAKEQTSWRIAHDRVHVLGSPRFCEEWQRVYQTLLPPGKQVAQNRGRLRVLYFDFPSAYRMRADDISCCLEAINGLDFADFIVKRHSRFPFSVPALERALRIDSETHSLELIRWADVIISTISSIVFDVFREGKIFLYPSFFTGNRAVFQDYGACWDVSTTEELLSALLSIHEKDSQLPYTEAQVEQMQSDLIYGGSKDVDVLGNYAAFLTSLPKTFTGERQGVLQSR